MIHRNRRAARDLIREVIIELKAPRRWRRGRRRQGRGKQNNYRRCIEDGGAPGRGSLDEGPLDEGVGASPPVVDRSSEASSNAAKPRAIRIIGASLGAAHEAWSRRARGMELSVRLAYAWRGAR